MAPEESTDAESAADDPTTAESAADDPTTAESADGPTDREVVRTAAEAAESVVFSRFDRSDIEDVDVTVSFEDGDLEVDVYLHVPDPGLEDPDRVVEDAALAARNAVDDLFDG